MDSVKFLRRVLVVLTVLVVLAVFLLIFQLTDLSFRAFDRLRETPFWFWALYLLLVVFVAGAGLFVVFKIWTVGRGKRVQVKYAPLSAERLTEDLARAKAQGLDVAVIEADIDAAKAPFKQLSVAFFGRFSTGKSALIRSLIPNAKVEVSPIGGSTDEIGRYVYRAQEGFELVLLDMPGVLSANSDFLLQEEVFAQARRAHLVCYVLDQALLASDLQFLEALHRLQKPMVAVLNKMNHYEEEDLRLVVDSLRAQLPEKMDLVVVASAFEESVMVRDASGASSKRVRLNPGNVKPLLEVLARVEEKRGDLDTRQRQALLALAEESLRVRLQAFRAERGQVMLRSYTKKAMLGGVAAVGPGSDVLIQGYLALDMVKAFAKLYEVEVQEVDLKRLLDQASKRLRTQFTVVLALAGNVCKAFPGVGTVLGGASHALAYGLVFESLGRALLEVLHEGAQGLEEEAVLGRFQKAISGNLEGRAMSLLQILLRDKNER